MLNILLVDDEGTVSEVLQQILTRLGHRTEIASGGLEALRMFDSRVYDLVITDILMPGVDGQSVARHIRSSDRPNTPVIGMSGTPWLLKGDIFDSVIDKPFNIKTLTNSICHAVENGSKLRTLLENKWKAPGFHDVLTSPLLATRSAAVGQNPGPWGHKKPSCAP
jgi:CheY-like chemotaxis protein